MIYIEREIESSIIKWLDTKEILIIRGSRQSGKTTLLNRLKEMLISKGVGKENIHYLTFEDVVLRMKFEENPKEFIEFYASGKGKKKNYFLLDEVQYIQDIGQKLKLVFDLFSEIKIIISGSSSFDLTTLGEYLVGRAIFFDLYPFSFAEFLKTKGKNYEQLYNKIKIDITKKTIQIKKTIFIDDLNKLLQEYLTFGSYPRVVLEKDVAKKKELLKNLFITYIEKDIVARYGIKYREETVKLMKALASSTGNVTNYETLTIHSGLKYNEVRKILPILEDSFVITLLKPFYKNLLHELRKNPKIYFIDFGFRNYLLERFEQIDYDYLYENFVLNELKRKNKIFYWRTTSKAEVDFIIEGKNEIIPIEIKTTPKITRSFRSFIQHYKPDKAFIINTKIIGITKINNCTIYKIPLVYL